MVFRGFLNLYFGIIFRFLLHQIALIKLVHLHAMRGSRVVVSDDIRGQNVIIPVFFYGVQFLARCSWRGRHTQRRQTLRENNSFACWFETLILLHRIKIRQTYDVSIIQSVSIRIFDLCFSQSFSNLSIIQSIFAVFNSSTIVIYRTNCGGATGYPAVTQLVDWIERVHGPSLKTL